MSENVCIRNISNFIFFLSSFLSLAKSVYDNAPRAKNERGKIGVKYIVVSLHKKLLTRVRKNSFLIFLINLHYFMTEYNFSTPISVILSNFAFFFMVFISPPLGTLGKFSNL